MNLKTIHQVGTGGCYYPPGSTITVDDSEAARLIELGAAVIAEDEAADTKAKPETPGKTAKRRAG